MTNESLTANEEIVDGRYPLGTLIGRSAWSALYETQFSEGEHAAPAVIRVCEVESAEAELLNHRLRNAAQLNHPNLLKIYAVGSSWVVMERADESLAPVLAERALSEVETREMLAPVLDALGYLHKNGCAHSRLKPSNVLAVNDRLKLSIDSVTQAGVGGAAEDMRALGVLIVQVLTRKTPREGWDSQDFDGIPQPLADIVRHCLDSNSATRWTVEQVKARLNAPPVVAPEILPEEDPDDSEQKTGVPKWIYAGLAALVLIVVLVAALRKTDPAPAPATPVTTTAAPREDLPVPPAATPQPARPGAPVAENKESGWSVIVAAYRSRALAEKRMNAMAKKWPRFEVSVVESSGEKAGYQVVLGHNLSQDQAQALRTRALKSGLPRDTYIKRAK